MKKVLAVALAAMLLIGMMSVASAATITINRDTTWDPNADSAKATYTYYKIFDAAITVAEDVDEATGELAGTVGGVTGKGNVVYTISGTDADAKIAVLPAIFQSELGADGKYYITLVSETTSASDIVAALKSMVDANTTLFTGTSVTSDEASVDIDVPSDGYYLIEASNGGVLAVQTIGDVTIKEKNDYPKIDKQQKKAADSSYTEAVIPAEIGKYIDYQVTVTVPADANKPIYVIDKMSAGLEYDNGTGLTLDPDVTYSAIPDTAAEYDAEATWQIVFDTTVVEANQGNDIVITYRAKVTDAALTDTGRENEVTLKYDNQNYILKDKVEYTTYFTGIEKVDGAVTTKKLKDVEFTLTDDDGDYTVTPVLVGGTGEDKDEIAYYVPGGSSNTVKTNKDGKIIIRGLDNTKTYTLTETKTNAGYNLLKTPKELSGTKLVEDTGTVYTTATFDQILNNQGQELPSTGGIGTTIFYVAGLIMVLGAATILIARRKADAE